jgi:hypothetical protein
MDKRNQLESAPNHTLIGKWNLYYHLPYDKNWDIASYKIIMDDIDTAEKLITINESIPEELVKSCMLFVMKKGILPLWEDPQNRTGGAFSFKVPNKNVNLVWRHLFYVLCGETLTTDKKYNHLINGISISPKKNFCIIKIWMADTTVQDSNVIIDIKDLAKNGCLFKKHEPEFSI